MWFLWSERQASYPSYTAASPTGPPTCCTPYAYAAVGKTGMCASTAQVWQKQRGWTSVWLFAYGCWMVSLHSWMLSVRCWRSHHRVIAELSMAAGVVTVRLPHMKQILNQHRTAGHPFCLHFINTSYHSEVTMSGMDYRQKYINK